MRAQMVALLVVHCSSWDGTVRFIAGTRDVVKNAPVYRAIFFNANLTEVTQVEPKRN